MSLKSKVPSLCQDRCGHERYPKFGRRMECYVLKYDHHAREKRGKTR